MERKYFLSEKSGNSFEIQPTCYLLSENNFIAESYFIQKNEWVLLEIENNCLQTQIDLTNVPDYVLVFLEANNHNWNVVGATYCLNKVEGAFGILTPHKKILCIPHESLIDINNLAFVSCVQTQSLPTWSSELATIENHIFVFFRLGIINLVINHESIRNHNLQLILKEYYEFADFDNDIFLLTNNKYSKFRLLEIINDILIPNGLKENEDYCLIDSYVVSNTNYYDQHPDCISIPWLSGYFHPSTDKFGEGNYIHFAKNNLIKRIVFIFYQYLKNNHCHTLKKGVKVLLIKDGYLYFGYEQFYHPDLKISILNILNNNYSEFIENKTDIELPDDSTVSSINWSNENRINYLKPIENKPQEKPLQYKAFLNGYGKFPYVILKTGYATFMQIPIHFNTNVDYVNFPGTNLNDISDKLLTEYKKDKTSELHDKLIEHSKWLKAKLEADKNREARICLVEGPEIAYYFDGNEITFNNSIPYGGTLVTQQNDVIAMNANHYL